LRSFHDSRNAAPLAANQPSGARMKTVTVVLILFFGLVADYLLYNVNNGRTAIWYLNNNVFVSAAYGPSLSDVWSLVAP
jgi:hypothetical protein